MNGYQVIPMEITEPVFMAFAKRKNGTGKRQRVVIKCVPQLRAPSASEWPPQLKGHNDYMNSVHAGFRLWRTFEDKLRHESRMYQEVGAATRGDGVIRWVEERELPRRDMLWLTNRSRRHMAAAVEHLLVPEVGSERSLILARSALLTWLRTNETTLFPTYLVMTCDASQGDGTLEAGFGSVVEQGYLRTVTESVLRTLDVLAKAGIQHNDLHVGNVLLGGASGVETFLYDWDLATSRRHANPYLADEVLCWHKGHCQKLNPAYDVYMFLHSIVREAKEQDVALPADWVVMANRVLSAVTRKQRRHGALYRHERTPTTSEDEQETESEEESEGEGEGEGRVASCRHLPPAECAAIPTAEQLLRDTYFYTLESLFGAGEGGAGAGEEAGAVEGAAAGQDTKLT